MVVTGRHGQVVRALVERAPPDVDIVALGRPELNLASEADLIVRAIENASPDVVVSAAAYTQVDKAEAEPALAFAVNERGAQAVARAARQGSVPLIHLSTDYVFDGLKDSPYVEEDATGPTGIYGASKLAGEQMIVGEQEDSVILRTAWVYSPFGSNFVKTMLRLAADRDQVAVVADQRGNPSGALNIADGVIAIARNLLSSQDLGLRGIFHMAGSGEATWAELAQAIFAASAALGGPVAQVRSITTAEYPTEAKRPANSCLDCRKVARVHGVRLPDWRPSLDQVVTKLLQGVSG